MQVVKDAEQRKDLQELDTLTHHLRSSWQILRADQPLRELYAQLHGSATPDDEAICKSGDRLCWIKVLKLSGRQKEERKKYENG